MVPATSGQRYHVALPVVARSPWRSTEFHMFLVALFGSAVGATRNLRADCAAWVMLHTYKSGGTTLRSLAHSWVTSLSSPRRASQRRSCFMVVVVKYPDCLLGH